MSLKDAVKIGIEENLAIEVGERQRDLTQINTTNGAAGMLPTVTAVGDLNYGLSNTRQQFLNGGENNIAAGSTFRANTGVRLAWTVFDGMAMFLRRDQLFNEFDLASLELKRQAQTLSANISTTYQDLVLQTLLIKIFDENVAYVEDLLALSTAKLEIGSVSKLDVLQAKTDLNELLNARELAKMEFEMSSSQLSSDLNRDASSNFTVDTSFILPNSDMLYESWLEKAMKSNYDIKFSQKEYEIAKKNVELAESSYMPRVDLNSALDISYLNSNAGFLTSNRSIGPSLGVTVSYNLFDGNRLKREMQIAELRTKISEIAIERVSLETKNQLFMLFQRYNYFVAQAAVERENLELAAENFELASALFENGGINQYDLRQVRVQRLAIQRRLVQAEFQMAVAYIGLLELSGETWL
jgi:outer membrane protein TolC